MKKRRCLSLIAVMVAAMLFMGVNINRRASSGTPYVLFPYQRSINLDMDGIIPEPSGICWHTQRKTLFVVSDENGVFEITTNGELMNHKPFAGRVDSEGVTHDPSTGLLYIAVEGKPAPDAEGVYDEDTIIEIDPEDLAKEAEGSVTPRRAWAVPRIFNGVELMKQYGNGIESITFVPDADHAEGGTFYIGNQVFRLDDPNDISAVFQLQLPIRTNKSTPQLLGYFEPGVVDISGLTYDIKSDEIFVISDFSNTIHKYSLAHCMLRREYALPGENQEGITFDMNGNVYITYDSGGISKRMHDEDVTAALR